MKKLSIVLSVVMMVLCIASFVACTQGGNDYGNKTVIYVEVKNGGTGTEWLTAAGERFAELKKDVSYAEGKQGVVIVAKPMAEVTLSSSETSGTAIYDLYNVTSVENYANAGKILCIDDIMTEKYDTRNGQAISVEDKISEQYRARFQVNGEYYGAPSCEYYPGVAYDINLFDKYGYYFADSQYQSEAELFSSEILDEDFYFIPVGEDDMKSCGPDGEFGTEDDGLPSSLYELIALCERMKDEGVAPFDFPGGYAYYSNFLLTALMASLQGYERASTMYSLSGEIEIVTGFTDEPLFPGVESIKKPTTKTITVTEETGYYTTWSVEKYYAEAFMELCIEKSWFSSSESDNSSQKSAIQKFVFSDDGNSEKIAMHIDGSYWYNEAKISGYLAMYEKMHSTTVGLNERKFGWMSLPVNYDTAVTEGEGKGQTFVEMWMDMLVINKNIEDNPELLNACKDFIKFLCTDSELSAYTSSTSIVRSLNYELTDSDRAAMGTYGQKLWDLVHDENNHVLYFEGNNATFRANPDVFSPGWDNGVFKVGSIKSYYQARKENRADYASADLIFRYQSIDMSGYTKMYRGTSSVTFIDGLTTIK